MNGSIWYKRIPTLLGLFLLIGGIFGINWAISHGVFLKVKLRRPILPKTSVLPI